MLQPGCYKHYKLDLTTWTLQPGDSPKNGSSGCLTMVSYQPVARHPVVEVISIKALFITNFGAKQIVGW